MFWILAVLATFVATYCSRVVLSIRIL